MEQQNEVLSFIIRGTIHQGNEMFPDNSRGMQCTAMAAAGILMSHVQNPEQWSANDIDNIIYLGENLFHKSIAERIQVHYQEENRSYLTTEEVSKSIQYANSKYTLKFGKIIYGHVERDLETEEFPKLKDLLKNILDEKINGILTCNGISIALIQVGNCIGVFDSHSRGLHGEISCDGVACFYVINTLDNLFQTIFNNIPKNRQDVIHDGQYQFTALSIEKEEENNISKSVNRTCRKSN